MAAPNAEHDGHRIDPAALMAAAVAAVLTIVLAEGSWWWLDVIIGIALLCVLFGFYKPTASRSRWDQGFRAAAFGAVAGLAAMLVASYPFQEWVIQPQTAWDCGGTWEELKVPRPISPAQRRELVELREYENAVEECIAFEASKWLFPLGWLVAAVGGGLWHFRRAGTPTTEDTSHMAMVDFQPVTRPAQPRQLARISDGDTPVITSAGK